MNWNDLAFRGCRDTRKMAKRNEWIMQMEVGGAAAKAAVANLTEGGQSTQPMDLLRRPDTNIDHAFKQE